MGQTGAMTREEQITKMTNAINHAIKIMGDRFGSTEEAVARAIQQLKESMQTASPPASPVEASETSSGQGGHSAKMNEAATAGPEVCH